NSSHASVLVMIGSRLRRFEPPEVDEKAWEPENRPALFPDAVAFDRVAHVDKVAVVQLASNSHPHPWVRLYILVPSPSCRDRDPGRVAGRNIDMPVVMPPRYIVRVGEPGEEGLATLDCRQTAADRFQRRPVSRGCRDL